MRWVDIRFYGKDGMVEETIVVYATPRENEHIFLRGRRYRVVQVQHHSDGIVIVATEVT